MKKINYKKGEYVVLLAGCNGNDTWRDEFPIYHVFRLKEDATNIKFYPELDILGNKQNGWKGGNPGIYEKTSKMRIRIATVQEYRAYIKNKGPISIDDLESIDNYQMY